MTKEKIERSEAILRRKRNTRKGLQVRNKILVYLYNHSNESLTASKIADEIGMTYHVVNYHLRSLNNEMVVEREEITRRVFWKITGLGQQTIKKWLDDNDSN